MEWYVHHAVFKKIGMVKCELLFYHVLQKFSGMANFHNQIQHVKVQIVFKKG